MIDAELAQHLQQVGGGSATSLGAVGILKREVRVRSAGCREAANADAGAKGASSSQAPPTQGIPLCSLSLNDRGVHCQDVI